MDKLCTVNLTDAERLFLHTTISEGTSSARTIARACVLLKADAGPSRLMVGPNESSISAR